MFFNGEIRPGVPGLTPTQNLFDIRGDGDFRFAVSSLAVIAGTEQDMMDILMVMGTIVFFVIVIAYTVGCEKLK